PLRGITFLNVDYDLALRHDIEFPSPYGELHFSIMLCNTCTYNEGDVSVPLRGITFLNKIRKRLQIDARPCFRPLTGNYISQSVLRFLRCRRTRVSVPLRGITFLNYSLTKDKAHSG